MSSTTTTAYTLAEALKRCEPDDLADALRKCRLDAMFAAVELDTGTITGTTSVTIPGNGALHVQSVRVVTGTEAAAPHVVIDSLGTPAQIGTTGVYTVKLSANGKTLTFAQNITRVIVRYIPNPATALTDQFAST
jgi:hypothetical protein